MEEFSHYRIVLFINLIVFGIEPPSSPIILKHFTNGLNVDNFFQTFSPRDMDFGGRLILMDGRMLFCTVYFTILFYG